MIRFLAAALALPFLVGCASYWAFPTGRTVDDFRRDEASCKAGGDFSACLQRLGYRQISAGEFQAIQSRVVAQPIGPIIDDIVAFDMATGELFIGKSESVVGAKGASITVDGAVSKLGCSGSARIVMVTPTGVGSTGEALLLCRDGRTISARFVYETQRNGWGAGKDDKGHEYRFKFGQLNIDTSALRLQFEQMLKDEKVKASTQQGA